MRVVGAACGRTLFPAHAAWILPTVHTSCPSFPGTFLPQQVPSPARSRPLQGVPCSRFTLCPPLSLPLHTWCCWALPLCSSTRVCSRASRRSFISWYLQPDRGRGGRSSGEGLFVCCAAPAQGCFAGSLKATSALCAGVCGTHSALHSMPPTPGATPELVTNRLWGAST